MAAITNTSYRAIRVASHLILREGNDNVKLDH